MRSNVCRSKSCNLKSVYDIILGQTNVFRLLSASNTDLGLLSSRRYNLMFVYDIPPSKLTSSGCTLVLVDA